jgi:hypothetical protein
VKPEDNFERFFHGEVVDVVRRLIKGKMPADAKISNARGFHEIDRVAPP